MTSDLSQAPPVALCPICQQSTCSLSHLRHRLTADPPQESWRSERLAHGMLVFGLMMLAFLALWHSLAPIELNLQPEPAATTTVAPPVAGHGHPSHRSPR